MIMPPPSSPLFPYTTLFRSQVEPPHRLARELAGALVQDLVQSELTHRQLHLGLVPRDGADGGSAQDRKSTRLNSSHITISYAVFCLKKKTRTNKLIRKDE